MKQLINPFYNFCVILVFTMAEDIVFTFDEFRQHQLITPLNMVSYAQTRNKIGFKNSNN